MSLADAHAADEALLTLPRAKLPPRPPAKGDVPRRMRETIVTHLTMSNSITERDLERAGFSRTEVADHFTAACRAVRAHRIA